MSGKTSTRIDQAFVDIAGAAVLLGLPRRRVEELIATERFPKQSFKVGRSRRWEVSELVEWARAGGAGFAHGVGTA